MYHVVYIKNNQLQISVLIQSVHIFVHNAFKITRNYIQIIMYILFKYNDRYIQ